MKTPEWVKPGGYGALIGAAFVAIAGFSWGGWVTGATAQERALALSRDSVVTAMVPVCLGMAQADPDRADKLAGIREARVYQRRDAVMETGWATMPGTDAPNRNLAQACLAALDVDAAPAAADPVVNEG